MQFIRTISIGQFSKQVSLTFITRVLNLILALGFTILVARLLGPEGKGIYTLAILLPTTIVMATNLGIGPATIYYVAQGKYSNKIILGNNLYIAIFFSAIGLLTGYFFIYFYRTTLLPGVESYYLYLALLLIIGNICFNYFQGLLLGKLIITKYNTITFAQSVLLIILTIILLPVFKIGIKGAIIANIVTVYFGALILFYSAYKISDGISLKLNVDYIRNVFSYGLKAHTGNVIGFLIYKIDLFLIGGIINTAAVGLYSVSAGLAERLWMISQTASFVLFPRVASEKDEQKKKMFTPIVSRNVFLLTIVGGFFLIILSDWLVTILYSEQYKDSVPALQILIPGIILLSAGRVLSNDISGRGKPEISIYTGVTALVVNIILNIIFIPKWGITGAAIASTISYSLSFMITLYFYGKISGNSWLITILPQKEDFQLYKNYLRQLVIRKRT